MSLLRRRSVTETPEAAPATTQLAAVCYEDTQAVFHIQGKLYARIYSRYGVSQAKQPKPGDPNYEQFAAQQTEARKAAQLHERLKALQIPIILLNSYGVEIAVPIRYLSLNEHELGLIAQTRHSRQYL